MREPGGLEVLGAAGRAAWSARVSDCVTQAADAVPGGDRYLRAAFEEESSEVTGPDWTGLPVRVTACLGRSKALRLLDWHRDELGEGGRALQDEYVEWRTVRSDDGRRITRVELTTELPDYWRVLAAYEPETLVETVAEFAAEKVEPSAVYGDYLDAAGMTPEEREQAFARTMLAPSGRNPYNNGERAICCMVQKSNSLGALALLTAAATCVGVVRDARDGRLRCMTCSEAIPVLDKLATRGRGSDPVLVERLGRLAYEGRLVSFDDPPGVYMQGVQHTRLRTPRGEAIPPDWFRFGRGLGPDEAYDGRPRYQRLTFSVPEKAGFDVSDVVDVATEQPLRSGAEIADLVLLAVFFRVSAPGTATGEPKVIELEPAPVDPHDCDEIRAHARLLEDELP
ncbi:MAG: hypothetical protein H0U03_03820 [Actinobacteria bacterium]|nr:hypothetical protein [Actinomycetota bacterium]